MTTKVSASVVLYNTPEPLLERLLSSIAQSSLHLKTYLIDNSPVALSYPCMQQRDLIYIKAECNKGYGAGHNIALKKEIEQSEFHFVLNPDIYFASTALESMVHFMQKDTSIGQLMPKIVYPDGSLQYLCKLLPTPADLIFRRFVFGPLKKLVQRSNNRFILYDADYSLPMDVPNLSGCFMLLRTSALRKVGIFDERFFMYLEDFDLTRRIRAHFRTIYYPYATVVHDHARASYKSRRALQTHIESAVKYFNKWGWVFDEQRDRFNNKTLEQLK